jgi:hypothetical protein
MVDTDTLACFFPRRDPDTPGQFFVTPAHDLKLTWRCRLTLYYRIFAP